MPFLTASVIGAIGVGLQAVSVIGGMAAASQQAEAQQRAENLRERSMNLDSMRRKREAIRQGEIARAQALSTSTAQGTSQSSILEGGYGSISGNENRNVLGINQAQEIGGGIFSANRDVADANSMAATFSGLGSLGGVLIKNATPIERLGEYFTKRPA